MGIVRDLYYARKMSAGLKLPAPTVALLIKRFRLAAAMGGGVEKTVSGSPAHITDALTKAALSVLVSIEPIQDLHGYSNPWPAGGGANKLSPHLYSGIAYNPTVGNTVTLTDAPQQFTDNGNGVFTLVTTSTWREYSIVVPLVEGNDYHLKFQFSSTGQGGISNGYLDSDYKILEKTNSTDANQSYDYNMGPPEGAAYYYIVITNRGTASATLTLTEPSITIGTTSPASWTPYSNICPISGRTGLSVYVSPTQDVADATTYAIDWTSEAGTVYGGTVDVVTGVLTVDRASVDMGTLNWAYGSAYGGYFNSQDIKNLVADTYECLSDRFKNIPMSSTAITNNDWAVGINCNGAGSAITGAAAKGAVVATCKQYTDAATFKTAMSGVQLCYELATPLTYQLTPQEVQMLLGENNIWSSSGDTVSVTYYAEGNANPLQSLNILLGGRYSNPKTADDVSDKEALEIILGGNK